MGTIDFEGKELMTEEKKKRKPLKLKLEVTPQASEEGAGEKIRQSLSHGRSKSVIVEVKRKRDKSTEEAPSQEGAQTKLTDQEQTLRLRAVQEAKAAEHEEKLLLEEISKPSPEPYVFVEPVIESVEVEKRESVEKREARFEEKKKREEREEDSELEEGPIRTKPSKGNHKKRTGRPAAIQSEVEIEEAPRSVVGLKKLRKGKKGHISSSIKRTVEIKDHLTIANLAVLLAKKSTLVLKNLHKLGFENLTLNSVIDADTAQLAAEEFGCSVVRCHEEDKEARLWDQAPQVLKSRPPVVTIMGHVDHGKTSLLDALRKTDVAAKEAGGITQHIGAYQVHLPSGKVITFIDTPGHEAFTQMRARGAQTTDIVILVVAADDGVKEQTIEAIRHVQAAKVPMIVAINKIDKPGARPDYVRQSLLSYDVVVEKMGGDVQDVEVSALTGANLDVLEEAILLQGDLLGLQADDTMRAKGIILETHMKKGHGVVATLLVQEGSLTKGDIFVVGRSWGRVRLLFDDKGTILNKAGPSQPVEVIGFAEAPQPGDRFIVVPSEAKAKEFVQWKSEQTQKEESEGPTRDLAAQLRAQTVKELPLIIKADAQGSLEGLRHELEKIHHEEVELKIIHQGVGSINEGDALLAQATGALIVGFNVTSLPEARKVIEQKGIRVLYHRIIYQAIDEVRQALSGLLEAVYEEEFLGRAEVIKIFHIKKVLNVAGCMIKEGVFRRNAYVRVIRNKETIYDGIIKSLRHVKEDVREIAAGYECGINIEGYSDYQLGDIFECFTKKEIKRSV